MSEVEIDRRCRELRERLLVEWDKAHRDHCRPPVCRVRSYRLDGERRVTRLFVAIGHSLGGDLEVRRVLNPATGRDPAQVLAGMMEEMRQAAAPDPAS